ncbi:MAG TPA: prepilin-type N-terminal cleavage/methylation domain-containing protein [Sumerlaeia bacterium]|nr:prepilin-type N-terminal cleavage/methylation domain-containing protein [Sumerlaeia bacterium]
MSRKNTLAFTLIELLIVVAIIAILAAIAVPNFLEAQTRAKISRVKSDLRAVATAIESYAVDYNNLPANEQCTYLVKHMFMITTPVAYITSVELDDPFTPPVEGGPVYGDASGKTARVGKSYLYIAYYGPWLESYYPGHERKGAVIHGYGPSRFRVDLEHYPGLKLWEPTRIYGGWITPDGVIVASPQWVNIVYDATNGTKSFGGIGRIVGELECEQHIGG